MRELFVTVDGKKRITSQKDDMSMPHLNDASRAYAAMMCPHRLEGLASLAKLFVFRASLPHRLVVHFGIIIQTWHGVLWYCSRISCHCCRKRMEMVDMLVQ